MRIGKKIDEQNQLAVAAMIAARPVWRSVVPAKEVATGLGAKEILHAGPPISWQRMSGAQRGAVMCAIQYEEWAPDADAAAALAASGRITLTPNHHFGGVGPMAGVVSPNMPVFVVEDAKSGRIAYAALEEPRMNFGAHDEAALELRRYWRDELAPTLDFAVKKAGGMDLAPIIARGLHRGDEMHNRPAAATSLMLLALIPHLIESDLPRDRLRRVVEFIHKDEIFFLSLSMAYSKLCADCGHGVAHSSVVTAMARNGTEFGIRVSGLGDRWFVGPSPVAQGLFLPGYSEADAGKDMGDSAITETVGLGGFVLPTAPAILEMVGATASQAFAWANEMREITISDHPNFNLPILDFAATRIGIDVRKVVDTGILPIIDTAIAHKEPGHPIIGAGMTRPPMEAFVAALEALAEQEGVSS